MLAALLEPVFANLVHLATKRLLKHMLKLDCFNQSSLGIRKVGNQQVNIAISTKITAKDGAKQGKLGHMGSFAQVVKGVAGDI